VPIPLFGNSIFSINKANGRKLMSHIKNISGPYTIHTINDDPITLDSNTVIIKGNLTIVGNSTSISSTDTAIADNIITLNAGYVGASPLPIPAGIEVVRGGNPSYPDVYIRWNELTTSWQATADGSTFYNIVSTATGNTRVVDDASPQLGGNLFTNGYSITNATGNIFLDPATTVSLNGNLSLQMAGNVWGNVQAYNTLIASQVGAGGTGIYVTTGDGGVTQQELITKRRAIVYSIVF
jgi:hypothetical protein